MRNSQKLMDEIHSFAIAVKTALGDDSKEYHDCTYFLRVLHEYYICPDSEDLIARDILCQFTLTLERINHQIPGFGIKQLRENYPNMFKMIDTLDSELPVQL